MNTISTPTHFAEWLRGKGAEATVGRRCMSCECPLACYLQDLNPGVTPQNVRIGAGIYTMDGYEGARANDLPKWATRFVQAIDSAEYAGDGSRPDPDFVTGTEAALALLNALDAMQEAEA